jgi:hypothetical protein
MADKQLKYPDDPLRASNRRISIRLPFVRPPAPIELPAVRQVGP